MARVVLLEHFPSKQMPAGRKKIPKKQQIRADDLMHSGQFPLKPLEIQPRIAACAARATLPVEAHKRPQGGNKNEEGGMGRADRGGAHERIGGRGSGC
jgi:hypothetical protein